MIIDTMYVLAVPDLARSADFYRDVLGFEVRDMGDPGWRMFVKDSCRIMAGECAVRSHRSNWERRFIDSGLAKKMLQQPNRAK